MLCILERVTFGIEEVLVPALTEGAYFNRRVRIHDYVYSIGHVEQV